MKPRITYALAFLLFSTLLAAQPVSFFKAAGIARINDATIDPGGTFWVATDNGLVEVPTSGVAPSHHLRSATAPMKVWAIAANATRVVAAGKGFMAIYTSGSWTVYNASNSSLDSNMRISQVFLNSNNEIYFIGSNKLYQWTGTSPTQLSHKLFFWADMDESSGRLYLCDGISDPFFFSFKAGVLDSIGPIRNLFSTRHSYQNDFHAGNGKLWVVTDDGVLQYNTNTNTWLEYVQASNIDDIALEGNTCYANGFEYALRLRGVNQIDTLTTLFYTQVTPGIRIKSTNGKMIAIDYYSKNLMIVHPQSWKGDWGQRIDNGQISAQFTPSGNTIESSRRGGQGIRLNGKHLMSAANLWYEGFNNGNRIGASPSYRYTRYQLFSGPKANRYDADYVHRFDRVWSVSQAQIDQHKSAFSNPNYNAPEAIMTWPGNGKTSNGESQILAPFEDSNYNGIYEPQLGEVPLIRGDRAAFMMFNDFRGAKTDTTFKGGGMEFHLMAYVYDTSDAAIAKSIFMSVKAINQSGNTLDNVKFGYWTDFDLGFSQDDAIGSDSIRQMSFAYNLDAYDEGPLGYGNNPPAAGVKFLNRSQQGAMYRNFSSFNQTKDWKETSQDANHFFASRWPNGNQLVLENPCGPACANGDGYTPDNSGTPTSWAFNLANNWYYAGNQGGDPGMLNYLAPIQMQPGATECIDLVVSAAQEPNSTGLLDQLNHLLQNAPAIQQFYDAQNFGCLAEGIELEENALDPTWSIYPNPCSAGDKITIEVQSGFTSLKLYSLNGQLILKAEQVDAKRSIELRIPDVQPGLYLLQLTQADGQVKIQKLLVK